MAATQVYIHPNFQEVFLSPDRPLHPPATWKSRKGNPPWTPGPQGDGLPLASSNGKGTAIAAPWAFFGLRSQ